MIEPDEPEQPRRRRRGLQTITLPRPRCPRCGSIGIRKYKSITNQGDDTALYWMRCDNSDCCHRFRMLME